MRRILVARLLAAAQLFLFCTSLRANSIASIVVDQSGSIYFSDYIRNRIWKLETGGKPTIWIRGKHTHHLVLDQTDTLYGEDVPPGGSTRALWQMTPEGTLTEVLHARRKGRALDYEGTVFTIDGLGNLDYLRDCQIVRLAADGRVTPWAGRRCTGAVWKSDTLRYGHLHGSLAWGPDSVLYFSDARTVRRVSPDGQITTLDGHPVTLFANPQPGEHRFGRVMGLAVDSEGSLFVAERRTRSVERIGRDGHMHRVVRLSAFWSPTGLGMAGRDLYLVTELRVPIPGFLAGLIGNPTIRRLSQDGQITTIATIRGR